MKLTLTLASLAVTPAVAQLMCDANLPRSLDGTCNNLNNELTGSAGEPFVYQCDQHYSSGNGDLLLFATEERDPGATNNYAMDVSSVYQSPGTCHPQSCSLIGTTVQYDGLGSNLGANPRRLSNALHATPGAENSTKQAVDEGSSLFITFFGQFRKFCLSKPSMHLDSFPCNL